MAPTVRPAGDRDDDLWRSLQPYASDNPRLAAHVERIFSTRSERAPECCLLALDVDGKAVGRLCGTFIDEETYTIHEIIAPDESVASELARHLHASFSDNDVEILSWERPANVAINHVLDIAGFSVDRAKVFVSKDLTGYRSPYIDPFTWRSLREVGEERFTALLDRARYGDPFDEGEDAREMLDEYRETAGELFDPDGWLVATLDDVEIGLVLPQIYPDAPSQGTMLYICVLPEHRGRGFGKIIHARGLTVLARAGMIYKGSTDERNAPMIAVFRANDCPTTTRQLFYRAATEKPQT